MEPYRAAKPRSIEDYRGDMKLVFDFMRSRQITHYNQVAEKDILDFIEHLQGNGWSPSADSPLLFGDCWTSAILDLLQGPAFDPSDCALALILRNKKSVKPRLPTQILFIFFDSNLQAALWCALKRGSP
jgi:hypothetical protein